MGSTPNRGPLDRPKRKLVMKRCIDCHRDFAQVESKPAVCDFCCVERNSAMTPERQARIVQALRDGVSLKGAAGLAGVIPTTVHNWLKRGIDDLAGPYYDFVLMVLKAEAELEEELATRWRAMAGTSPHAMKEFMSRRFKEVWAEKTVVEEKRTIEVRKTINVADMTEEELDALDRLLEAKAAQANAQLSAGAIQGSVVPHDDEDLH